MREPNVKCFIQPRRDNGKHEQPEAETADGLAALPEPLLLRHGAVVLDPATAVSIPGWPAPRSTVYRARTLLVPGQLLQGRQSEVINAVLAQIGMRLVAPDMPDEADGEGFGARLRQQLPRPAVLSPLAPSNGAL